MRYKAVFWVSFGIALVFAPTSRAWEASSVEDFKNALAPKQKLESPASAPIGKIRGLGGTRPSVGLDADGAALHGDYRGALEEWENDTREAKRRNQEIFMMIGLSNLGLVQCLFFANLCVLCGERLRLGGPCNTLAVAPDGTLYAEGIHHVS